MLSVHAIFKFVRFKVKKELMSFPVYTQAYMQLSAPNWFGVRVSCYKRGNRRPAKLKQKYMVIERVEDSSKYIFS